MKQKTRFKKFGNIGIGLKKAVSVDLYTLPKMYIPETVKQQLMGPSEKS